MPLTAKGTKIMGAMKKFYKSPEKAKQVFSSMKKEGKLKGVEVKSKKKASVKKKARPKY